MIPLLVGKVSEMTSYHFALIGPADCYAVLCAYALASYRARVHLRDEPAAATIH
jgi:FHS family L-fucose permease-like MFS transporter